MARSNSDALEYVRDLSQPRGLNRSWSPKVDSVLGAQANLALSANTEAVLQVISRYRYDGTWRPEVSWAFLGHEFTPGLKLRLGRLGTEFYMQSDSRLVGYSSVTVRPAPDFFGPLIFSYFDGADLSASTPVSSGLLSGKAFIGRSPETTPFYGDIVWNLQGSRLAGGYLDYVDGPWQFRASFAEVRFSSHEIPVQQLAEPLLPGGELTALVPEMSTVGKSGRFSSLGAIYDSGPLRVQAMIGQIRQETRAYENSWSAFVLASYRVGEFTPFVGFSTVKSSPQALSASLPPPLAMLVDQVRKPTHMDRHTLTLGTRWDFRENLALKAQFDAVRGDPGSYMPFRGDGTGWSGNMRILSVALDFAF